MPKKLDIRKRRPYEEKRRLVMGFLEARRARPGLSLRSYGKENGIVDSMLRRWAQQFGIDVSADALSKSAPRDSAPPSESAVEPAPSDQQKAAPPGISDWVAKHGAQLRESESSQTLASSGTPSKKKTGRPSNAELALRRANAEQSERDSPPPPHRRYAFEPRRVTVEPPDDERQPSLPFRAEPVQRQAPPAPPSEFYAKVTEQALKERDAVMTVLQMMIRENGGKLPGTQ